jgi:hypothetical protein
MKVSTYIVLFALLITGKELHAQPSGGPDLAPLPERFLWEVKQLDQFIGRFNGEEDLHGRKPKGSKATGQEARGSAMVTLFNQELLKDSAFRSIANEFVGSIVKNNKESFISFYDREWYSTVVCSVLYKSKPQAITLTLVSEGDSRQGTRWVIAGAEAPFLKSPAEREVISRIIPPTNHELNFPDLVRAFNQDAENIEEYASAHFRRNQLKALMEAVRKGDVQMKHVQSTTYHFLQVPGWIFTVNFYNRNSRNSGWLISSLKKVNNKELHDYKAEQLNIYP